MGGPSLLDGLPPLSVAKTLSYFHDLTECPKSHPLAKSICLLSLSHALSFKGHSGQGKENLKSSFFQTFPKAKEATQGWRAVLAQIRWVGVAWMALVSFKWREGPVLTDNVRTRRNQGLLGWLCLPKSALHGSNLHHNPSAQITAAEMHLSSAVDKTSPFLIPLPTIPCPADFSPCFPKASSICLWGLKVTCWAGLLQWHHFPGDDWAMHSWRCPDATEPHEPIIELAVRDPTSASLLDVANQLHY